MLTVSAPFRPRTECSIDAASPPRVAGACLLAALLLVCASCAARADDAAASRHQDWRSCLSRNFRIEAALSGPDRAADAAFKACRGP